MRGERGQASIEWIGAALLLALALTALGRLAGHVDAALPATTLLSTTTCAARGDCEEHRPQLANLGSERAVTTPPLVPVARGERLRPARPGRMPPGPPSGGVPPVSGAPPRAGSGRARRAAGVLWRRAWLLCFGYERARFGLLHPESGPRQTVPLSGVAQMVNDCTSPVDVTRDWEHLRPR